MRIYGPNGTTLGVSGGDREADRSDRIFAAGRDSHIRRNRAAAAPQGQRPTSTRCWRCRASRDPVERRKRSVQRGKGALDVLDDLKIGLLSGNFDASTVSRLREAAADLKSTSGDPGLDAVLSEIELRVEVELAKAGQF